MTAAAKLIQRRRRYDHVIPLLRDLRWLKSSERVDFKLAVTTCKCLHGLAPPYLVDSIQRVAESGRRYLRSSSTEALVVTYIRLVTAGDRAFSSFDSRLCNSLPPWCYRGYDIVNFQFSSQDLFVSTFIFSLTSTVCMQSIVDLKQP
jgi:hypothetical protein